MKSLISKKVKTIFIILALIAGFYLRLLQYFKFIDFQGDEGNHFLIFENFIRFGKIVITGEGSSITDKSLYFHNLPYSLYFQKIIFILANQSPLMYMFLYVILGMLFIWMIWQTAKNFFGEKAGLIALFLAAFSQQAIRSSTFASQPTNAVLFETISLYFFSLFKLKKRKIFFIASFVFGVFAMHMYPPMYLFIPIKILFILINFGGKIIKNKKIVLLCAAFLIISYLPLIINEVKYYNQETSNLTSVRSFLEINKASSNEGSRNIVEIIKGFWLIVKSTSNSIHYNLYQLAAVFWIVIISLLFIKKDNKLLLIYFLSIVMIPMLLVAIFQSNIINERFLSRAYFDASFIYIILLAAGAISYKSSFIPILMIFSIIFISPKPIDRVSINYFEKEAVANKIIDETNKQLLSLDEIDIRVSHNKYSNNDGNWDNSMYWYFLQKRSKSQLVDVSYPFLTPELISNKTKISYFICEDYFGLLEINNCRNKAKAIYPDKRSKIITYSKKIGLILIY